MTNFGERMQQPADIITANSLASKQMTDADRVQIKKLMIEAMEEESSKGNHECSIYIDTCERADDKDKGTKLENKPDELLMESIKKLGVTIVYNKLMHYWCDMEDCDCDTQYGYELSW